MVQQKACSRQKSKPVFVQSFLACFKSLSAYLKHYRPFCCTEYIKTKHPIRKSKPPNFSHSVIYLRRLWAIPFVVILATGVGPKDTSAQNNAPAATSTPSADDAFRKGFEAFQRKDFSQALISLRQAADQGDGRAQTMLGLMYRDGDGARQDHAQALIWLGKAAQQGDAVAQANLSVMYAKGEGTKQDYPRALIWLRKAADQNHAAAQGLLGTMYLNGEYGVKQDYAQALLWLSKSAEQGLADAQSKLGFMYANGRGVTQDLGKAIEWSQKAAAQGDAQAQQNLQIFQNIMRGPSDDEIIQAVKDRLRHDTIESIKAEYAGVDKQSTDNPFSIFQAKSKAAVSLSLACSLNAPKDRQPCLDKMKAELLADRAARLKETQNKDLDAAWVFSIRDKTRYENNYVSSVNIRQRGNDKTFRWKLLLDFANGAWTIAERTEQAVK